MNTHTALPPAFANLQPSAVWAHFAALCAIPRASKQEAAVRHYIEQRVQARALFSTVDATGNLLVRKAAHAGCEAMPTTILQAHLDMVCQNNADHPHDFTRDPITPVLKDGFLVAENTTLGADNGIGVAMILAVLEDDTLAHGPLEALFTIDEESGMGGARGLDTTLLQGKRLVNLDTEDWGFFYLGCAGGINVHAEGKPSSEALPADYQVLQLNVRGLRGGHSGINIHEGRGNAIKLLVRLLCSLQQQWPLRLARFDGGNARNAIPREASALIALPADAYKLFPTWLASQEATLRAELAGIDAAITLDSQPATCTQVLKPTEQAAWLAALHAAPSGVQRMSVAVPGVVETSVNLGIAHMDASAQKAFATFMVRSLVDSGSQALADEITSLFSLIALCAEQSGHYPGWQPNPQSSLLALCQRCYQDVFNSPSRTCVIHAGLECGIIGGKYPDIDMISFGPTIHGAHAPGESVDIASVGRCWQLLRAILVAMN